MNMGAKQDKPDKYDPNGDYSVPQKIVHQIIIDHQSESIDEFARYLNEYAFLVVRHMYSREEPDGTRYWQDKGGLCINTNLVGKAIEYREPVPHETQRNFGNRTQNPNRTGSQVRGSW
jgi:hypothetical protein